jgi:hypothetical protein
VTKKKSNAGRPTAYKPEYNEQVFKLCLLGCKDDEIAAFFEVCEATINNWKLEFPQFLESMRDGKQKADAEIAKGLYDRAKGAEWTEDQAFKVKRVEYENGKRVLETEEIKTVPVRKAAPPDTTAAVRWLTNRDPARWRDKVDVEHSGKIESIEVIRKEPE